VTPPLAPSPIRLFGASFQNPVLLASGTAGFGREVSGVIDLEALGGIITKAVTPEPRRGARAPRVAEFAGGMLNAVGLANPGLDAVREHELAWLGRAARRARAGHRSTVRERRPLRLSPRHMTPRGRCALCPLLAAGRMTMSWKPGQSGTGSVDAVRESRYSFMS